MNRLPLWMIACFALGAIVGPTLFFRPAHGASMDASLQPVLQNKLHGAGLTPPLDEQRRTPVVRAVEAAGPSVVNIQVGRNVRTMRGIGFEKDGEASGVIVDKDGLVITNWHVIRRKDATPNFQVYVLLRNGKKFSARVLSQSRENDLALLEIEVPSGSKQQFQAIEMGNSDQLMVGETMVAIGNPRGQANTVTAGVLSATNRNLRIRYFGQWMEFKGLLQTDAAISPGNSGGALIDITGKLVGVNTLMQTNAQNINFAIPVNKVRKVFESTLLNQSSQLWLGIETKESANGIFVSHVAAEGPSRAAGIKRNDRILYVLGKKITNKKEYAKALLGHEEGQLLTIRIQQGSKTKTVRVKPWSSKQRAVYQYTGMFIEEINQQAERRLYRNIRRALQANAAYGTLVPMRIMKIQENSPAIDLGLTVGDLIVGYRSIDLFGDPILRTFPNGVDSLANHMALRASRERNSRGRLRGYSSSMSIEIYRDGAETPLLYGELELR